MKKIHFVILLFVIVFFTGCPKSTPVRPAVLERAANYEIQQLEDNLYGYECAYFGRTLDITETSTGKSGKTTRTRSCAQGTVIDKVKAQRLRDATVYRLIRIIDYNYFEFENELYVKRSTASFLADAIDVGGNLAGVITNGERSKTIINAALVAFRSTRKSASINYFQEQTADVLITKMQTARNRELADILDQLKNQDVDDYSLDAALGDAIKYFYAGTLPRALQELKKDAGVAAQIAENEVRVIKDVKVRTPATLAERDGSVDASRTLNLLAKTLASSTAADSEKTEALAKLKKIAEQIKKNQNITDELNKNIELKVLLDDLTKNANDGIKLVNTIDSLRFGGEGNLTEETLKEIDRIITNVDKTK